METEAEVERCGAEVPGGGAGSFVPLDGGGRHPLAKEVRTAVGSRADGGGVFGDHRGGGCDCGGVDYVGAGVDDPVQDSGADRKDHLIAAARFRSDTGQAFPLYIVAIAGLLFLAVAYFAVGQAAATRNDAQGAADAAALAAAQDAREQLGEGLLDAITDPDSWGDLLGGEGFDYGSACGAAQEFAGKNDADSISCDRVFSPDDGFTVRVRTRGTVGDSLVPGTENTHAETTATAVIESRCGLKEPEDPDEEDPPIELDCDDRDWTIDLDDLDLFPEPSDLFTVRLVD